MSRKSWIVAAIGAAGFALPALAPAALLVDFQPVTAGANVQWTGTPGSKTLTITSPLVNLRSVVNVPTVSAPIVDGYEVFDDTTLTFTFTETGPALNLGGGSIFATVTGGTFTFTSSPAYGSVVLLQGFFDGSNLFGTAAIGSVMSPAITYTGGLINTVIPVHTGDSILGLSLVNPVFGVTTASVNDFTARLQGQLTTPVVPEPASMGAVGVAGLALLSRRRRV